MLQAVINFINSPQSPNYEGFVYVAVLCVAAVAQTAAVHQYFFNVNQVGLQVWGISGVIFVAPFDYKKYFREKF